MTAVADTGPLLHLFWVDALAWALPPEPIFVVEAVWQEVERHDADVLKDARLRRVATPNSLPAQVAAWNLDGGEEAALCYALEQVNENILMLCDETRARKACNSLGLPVIGSIGLIVEAFRAGRVSHEATVAALRGLPTRGRLHIKASLIDRAIAGLEEVAP